MQIKSLAQGENILMLGIEPSTFVSKIDILTTTPIVHLSYEFEAMLKNANNVFFIMFIIILNISLIYVIDCKLICTVKLCFYSVLM